MEHMLEKGLIRNGMGGPQTSTSLADQRVESPKLALTTVPIYLLKQHVFHGQQQILNYRNIALADLKKWREIEQCHSGKIPNKGRS